MHCQVAHGVACGIHGSKAGGNLGSWANQGEAFAQSSQIGRGRSLRQPELHLGLADHMPRIGEGRLAIGDQAADMVTVAVGDEDRVEVSWPDACIGHIGNQLTCLSPSGVNEDFGPPGVHDHGVEVVDKAGGLEEVFAQGRLELGLLAGGSPPVGEGIAGRGLTVAQHREGEVAQLEPIKACAVGHRGCLLGHCRYGTCGSHRTGSAQQLKGLTTRNFTHTDLLRVFSCCLAK